MAGLMKRLQAHAAPVLLVYTVMVTWVLISTAWRDEAKTPGRLRRQGGSAGGASFLDVLVQEERRHMRSFRDVLRSYRDAPRSDEDSQGDKVGKQDASNDLSDKYDEKIAPKPVKSRDTSDVQLSYHNEGDTKASNLPQQLDNKSDTDPGGNDLTNTNDGELRRGSARAQNAMVEVEEWDGNDVKMHEQTANLKKETISQTHHTQPHFIVEKSDLVDVNFDPNILQRNALSFKNKTVNFHDVEYLLEFCDRVFDDPRIIPNICNRPVVELTSKKHVPVNPSSLFFRKISDVRIYSAFLDTRTGPFVRAMVLAPAGFGSIGSKYWCVFHIPDIEKQTQSNDTGQANNYSQGGSLAADSVLDDRNRNRQATAVSFYAASDGHGRTHQFYIASCPVPRAAYTLYCYGGNKITTIQMRLGSAQTAFVDDIQESIFVDVVVNKPMDPAVATAASLGSRGVNKTLLVAVASESVNNLDQDAFEKGSVYNGEQFGMSQYIGRSLKSLDYNDDDEDKELARGKKSHTSAVIDKGGDGQSKSRPSLSSNNIPSIPHPYRQVGELIVSCVAPLHGRVSTVQMVEFVELSLLLGVQHLVFYVPSSVGLSEARAVLRMYESRGLVTSLPWDLPFTSTSSVGTGKTIEDVVWARGRDIALNDCLYRVVHLYDWALFLDLDEFFVPRVTPDLPSFLLYLRSKHRFNDSRVTDLVFPSAYFPPATRVQYRNLTTAPDHTADVSKFASLKNIHRTYFDQRRTLRMLRPDAAFRVGAGERKRTSFHLSTRYAAAHHYSFCPRTETAPNSSVSNNNNKDDNSVCSHLKVDWIMWRYKLLLIERTKTTVRRLNKG